MGDGPSPVNVGNDSRTSRPEIRPAISSICGIPRTTLRFKYRSGGEHGRLALPGQCGQRLKDKQVDQIRSAINSM